MPNSPAPGTPQTPYKAYAAALVAALGTIVMYWVMDSGKFTEQDLKEAVGAAIVLSGLTGGATFGVRNKAK